MTVFIRITTRHASTATPTYDSESKQLLARTDFTMLLSPPWSTITWLSLKLLDIWWHHWTRTSFSEYLLPWPTSIFVHHVQLEYQYPPYTAGSLHVEIRNYILGFCIIRLQAWRFSGRFKSFSVQKISSKVKKCVAKLQKTKNVRSRASILFRTWSPRAQ